MEVVTIGKWKLKCDAAAIRRAFSGLTRGAPESCGCEECLNFATVPDRAYPPEALVMFAQLGIDYRKESDIWDMDRDESGLHHYSGCFHFVGAIEGGENAKGMVNGLGTYKLEPIGERFEFGFTSDAAGTPETFIGKEVLQLEFQTKVAWLPNGIKHD